jgi:hypothetical protein
MPLVAIAPLLCVLALPTDETHFAASAAPTRFSAANTSPNTQLLLLGDPTHGTRAQMLIAPGASFETFFPSTTLDGLYIEIVSFTASGRKASGAVSFASVLATGVESLSIEISGGVSVPWLNSANGRTPADSGFDLAPACLMTDAANPNEPLLVDPLHVPVITPSDVITNTVAPKIRPVDTSI